MNGQDRSKIERGIEVDIVLKEDQPTGRLTRGVVQDILTSKGIHPRGIKVRLSDGQVGRVQHVVGTDGLPVKKTEPKQKFSCPCCGFKTFDSKPPGTFDICPVCYWEDDPVQFENPDDLRGSNGVSLLKARENFAAFGACEERYQKAVRNPLPNEMK